jgi:hypothetical protein
MLNALFFDYFDCAQADLTDDSKFPKGIASLPISPKTITCAGTGATFVGEEIDISKVIEHASR